MTDIFRPHYEPAATIYDTLIRESKKRASRTCDEWIKAERHEVWMAAIHYAQECRLRVPTMEDVVKAETNAVGHSDYASKFAIGVAESMQLKHDHPAHSTPGHANANPYETDNPNSPL